jgi:hypothetical protein
MRDRPLPFRLPATDSCVIGESCHSHDDPLVISVDTADRLRLVGWTMPSLRDYVENRRRRPLG